MEEKVKQQYDRWLSQSGMPTDLAEELKSIAGDEDAITDRFYRELEFGTGGLRGVIGAGTNRMNVYNQPQPRQVQRLQGLRRRRLPDHP